MQSWEIILGESKTSERGYSVRRTLDKKSRERDLDKNCFVVVVWIASPYTAISSVFAGSPNFVPKNSLDVSENVAWYHAQSWSIYKAVQLLVKIKKTIKENHESPKKENKNKQKETEMEKLRGFQRCREYWKQ